MSGTRSDHAPTPGDATSTPATATATDMTSIARARTRLAISFVASTRERAGTSANVIIPGALGPLRSDQQDARYRQQDCRRLDRDVEDSGEGMVGRVADN